MIRKKESDRESPKIGGARVERGEKRERETGGKRWERDNNSRRRRERERLIVR
jgi:hypothetical protein